jgi:glucose/mannose-6-phosphate isomerase
MSLALTYRKNDFYFLVFESEKEKIAKRIAITARITNSNFHIIKSKGASDIEKMFYLLHYGDYLTYHLAMIRGIDPTDVSLIQKLKKMLKNAER